MMDYYTALTHYNAMVTFDRAIQSIWSLLVLSLVAYLMVRLLSDRNKFTPSH
ncbi:hypothetical protein V5E97_06785 [Singulisphaera sp. Ch08]|uniref:Uncharacterized protein n=1 Tax=Singulisphaera sp. Ch08 TaxID=3120278 RepID=A0AAU7CL30_9BACT